MSQDGLSKREKYMLDALAAIAKFGKNAEVVLRPYMESHGINWNQDEDVKTWMQRIAQDAIDHATKS